MMVGQVVLVQVCQWMEGWRGQMEAVKGRSQAGCERVGSDEGRRARSPGLGEFLPPGPRGCFRGVSAGGPPLNVSFFTGNAAVEPNEASSWRRHA